MRVVDSLDEALDEDIELELEDTALPLQIAAAYREMHPNPLPSRIYFHELLRLQAELIKLQSWVAHHKEKVVVIFEGRDSAGKGGAIKRITQRLNPRVARVVALHPETVAAYPSYRAAKLLKRLPARSLLRRLTRQAARTGALPVKARAFALRLYRAAVYADAV